MRLLAAMVTAFVLFISGVGFAQAGDPRASDTTQAAVPAKPQTIEKTRGGTGMSKEPSAAQKLIGDFDPKLAELTDNVLFGDVWERPGLSKRDRSLITVAALIALNRQEQLRSHLRLARENGVTKDEVVEVITHLAFYTGWPNAINAVAIAKETFK